MPNGKNIALFLDGTWNTVNNNTNVWRAKSLCSRDNQTIYYSQGVGTLFGQRFIGGVFGYGLDQEVIDAYEWLIEHYEPGDHLYLFGFSRGAYTARSLAGLISKFGVLKAGSPLSIDQLYARYRNKDVKSIRELQKTPKEQWGTLAVEERWLLTYSQAIAIWFIGVWDTVGSLGFPYGNIASISRSRFDFLQTDLWLNDDTAYHALALDEHRVDFRPTFWTWPLLKGDSQAVGAYAFPEIANVEQRWFVGAHANVGGGYNDDVLAQRPLKWLLEKAQKRGLAFKGTIDLDGDQNAKINDSFKEMLHGVYAFFKGGRRFFRPVGTVAASPKDTANNVVNETIDGSVFERWRSDATYRPQNLVDWATRAEVDPAVLLTSVRADDPKVPVTDD